MEGVIHSHEHYNSLKLLVSEVAYGPQRKVLGWSPQAQKLVLWMEEEMGILQGSEKE